MTIRQRLTASFALILALFLVNLIIYFWGSQKRNYAISQLEDAVYRQLLIQEFGQKVSDVKNQIGVWNQYSPGALTPQVTRDMVGKIAAILEQARQLETSAPASRRESARQFYQDARALTRAWSEFLLSAGKDEARAITALSGERGADRYSELILNEHVPAMSQSEANRIATARRNNQGVMRLTRATTVALFVASIVMAALVAFSLSSYLARGLNELEEGASLIGRGNLGHEIPITRQDELGALAVAFNEMSANLQTANQELERRHSDLLERDAELRAMNEQLLDSEQKALAASHAKSEFLAKMSHELRTPLNAIIGYSEMLQEEAEDTGQTSFVPDLQKIRSAGKHLLALINDVLDLSKIEAGKMEIYLEDFDVEPMVRDVVATVQPLVAKNRNELRVSCAEGLGTMRSDLTKVRQALFNLLSNASKFTQDGRISLDVERKSGELGSALIFRIADTGIGMTQQELGKLFQEFSQASEATTRNYGGTGLGLAITQRFARMLGGDVAVESEQGRGSVFTITLPAMSVNPDDETGTAVLRDDAQRNGTGRRRDAGNLALIIDDDETIRDLIARYLSQDGIEFAVACSGEEGVRLAKELLPSVITLDVMMPTMDGWAVLAALKADVATADIPVVMLTVLEEQERGFSLGATDYLTKPVDREKLASVLQRYWREGDHHPVLVVEDDSATRELLRKTLERAGWDVDDACNGRVALEQIRAATPDLILLDLMMPEMDGFEFISELRKIDAWKAIPIVVVTARTLSQEDRDRLAGGVKRILQKGSYSRDELLQEVRRLVTAHVGQRGSPKAVEQR